MKFTSKNRCTWFDNSRLNKGRLKTGKQISDGLFVAYLVMVDCLEEN